MDQMNGNRLDFEILQDNPQGAVSRLLSALIVKNACCADTLDGRLYSGFCGGNRKAR